MEGFSLLRDPFIGTKGFIVNQKTQVGIRNFQNDVLTVSKGQPTATFVPDVDIKDQAIFYMNIYKEVAGNNEDLPVAITCKVDNKHYLLCVVQNSVILKESKLPEEIQSKTNECIFYLRDFSLESSIFESSVMSGFRLGCSEDGRDLILIPYSKDEFDKTTAIFLKYFSSFRTFKKNREIPYCFENISKDLLIAHPEESIVTFDSQKSPTDEKSMFYVNMYREVAPNDGLPVAISCKVNEKNYLLCATNNSVILKESELPDEIPTKTSELIFYAKDFSLGDSSYRFLSSLKLQPSKQGLCLAWDHEDPRKMLILKPYEENSIDETMKMLLINKA